MADGWRRHLGAVAAAGAVLLGAGAAWGQGWWNPRWPYRRTVTVARAPASKLPGDDVAVLTMPTGGVVGPAGEDIRVIAPDGTSVPHRVLMMGPGDRVRLAFAVKGGATRYAVYFGHPQPPQPRPALEIRRGVLLETRAYAGGPISTFDQVRTALSRAGRLIGREFRDSIFLGHNPFGPQSRLCSLFTAHVVCPADGQYIFATSSRDASFLLVDGEVVVSNGGRHRPQRRASRTGTVRLTKGLHEVKVYHVSTGGDPVVVAAWRPPGARRLWKIPAAAFAPVRSAAPGMLTRCGRAFQADFIPVHAGEAFMANRYFQRYTFAASTSGRGPGPTFRWDFGDGQTGS
ncbi:MAG: PA14 domain-containing protein, partial [Planctomycetota bacterium]